MVKSTCFNRKNLAAMTLIEVLVALSIVAFVFTSLLQMTFDSLRRAKNLELQDKMRNYATELVQVVYNAKDTDWTNTFGETAKIPAAVNGAPVIQQPMGYLDVSNPSEKPKIAALNYGACHFDAATGYLSGGDCELTAANEVETATNKKIFGRIIVRYDNNQKEFTESQDTQNDANIEVIVACIEGKCDSKVFKPFKLNFQVYRTSGPE